MKANLEIETAIIIHDDELLVFKELIETIVEKNWDPRVVLRRVKLYNEARDL